MVSSCRVQNHVWRLLCESRRRSVAITLLLHKLDPLRRQLQRATRSLMRTMSMRFVRSSTCEQRGRCQKKELLSAVLLHESYSAMPLGNKITESVVCLFVLLVVDILIKLA